MQPTSSFGRRGAARVAVKAWTPAPVAAVAAVAGPDVGTPRRWAIESDPDDLPRLPSVAIGLIALLFLVYGGEQLFGFEPGASQSHRSLVALGAEGRSLVVGEGQWWRIPTAILLHGGVQHLFDNCVALAIAGVMLERRLGGAWFAATFVLGGLAGAAASMAFNPVGMIDVGASGAIMALLVPSLIEAFGHETIYTPKRARLWVLLMVVSALIPAGGHVNYSAHFGGAVVGGLMGYALLFAFPALHDAPAGRRAAAAMSLAGLATAAASFILVALHYGGYAAHDRTMIPDGEAARISKSLQTPSADHGDVRTAGLVARYPNDPRAHVLRALALLQADRVGEADEEVRTALAQREVLARDLPPSIERSLHGLLAIVLLAEGQLDGARNEARDLCANPSPPTDMIKMKDLLKTHGACD